ncbi:hypothetical protein D6853_09665 [Butyrivibrio sp. X503]|uniref:hypothetical protein n=1 Tax=Butyrivibrio sp. X503 TaxID=2364878 RepID=UPI000EAA31EA|nr:hypothetical protein [Butyrivibrio sp. X503]RKM55803.1 hypothetical protein D6853_09665 [Butyrivibrio sp. X503]
MDQKKVGRWFYDRYSPKKDENGKIVLMTKASFGPLEAYKWGINADNQLYEEYQWIENDFFKDENYVRIITPEEYLEVLRVQPVGNGWIDMICAPDDIEAFIDFCNVIGKTIKGFTWWCHVTEGHTPCGMGGPKSKYYEGWFSEIQMDDLIRFKDNESYRDYFRYEWPAETHYKECYWPGFWLKK